MSRELLQEIVEAVEILDESFDATGWLERARKYLDQTADLDPILNREATRRELPAYERSVPGVVLVGARAE